MFILMDNKIGISCCFRISKSRMQASFKDRQQVYQITSDCFQKADTDRSQTITLFEFYHFLQLVFGELGLQRSVSEQECEQLFRFYDDNRSGFLTHDELGDVVWDIYTSDVQNDRVAYQQMLEKVLLTKLYSRSYNDFNTKNLFGKWGKANNKGDWKNYRFNDYQMKKMTKFGYDFNKAKKKRAMKKKLDRMPLPLRAKYMKRFRETQEDIEDLDDLQTVEDLDDSEEEDSRDEGGFGGEDSLTNQQKITLKRIRKRYRKARTPALKKKYLQKVREDGYQKFADIIEGKVGGGEGRRVGGGGSNVPQIEVDVLTLVRVRKRYLKAKNKEKYLQDVRDDGYNDVADVIEGKVIATNDPDPDAQRQINEERGVGYGGRNVGAMNSGNFMPVGGNMGGGFRPPLRQIEVDVLTLVRVRKRFLKAKDKQKYMQDVRDDGYNDVADVIEGKAIATNDPDPEAQMEINQKYNSHNTGPMTGGGGFMPHPTREIEVDVLTLVRVRKRYLKAKDKQKYMENVREDGYNDVADVIEGKAIATNDPDPDAQREINEARGIGQGGFQGGFNQGGFNQGGFNQGGFVMQGQNQGPPFVGQGMNMAQQQHINTELLKQGQYPPGATVIKNGSRTTIIIPGSTPYHRPDMNSQFGQQQMMLDPFSWQKVPQLSSNQEVALPSESQLTPEQMEINVQNLYEMSQYLQVQEVTLVTPIRSRPISQEQALHLLKMLPGYVMSKGFNGTMPYTALYIQFVNMIETGQY